MTAVIVVPRRNVAPFGLDGGEDGAAGRQWVERADGTHEVLNGTDSAELTPGDVFVIERRAAVVIFIWSATLSALQCSTSCWMRMSSRASQFSSPISRPLMEDLPKRHTRCSWQSEEIPRSRAAWKPCND